MGDKTRKFARRLEEKDLFEVILREGVFYRPVEILQLLDDNDPKVLEIFLSVRRRLEEECLEEGEGGEAKEAERLLNAFNNACRSAGIFSGGEVTIARLNVVKKASKDPESVKDLRGLVEEFNSQIKDSGEFKKSGRKRSRK